MKKSSIVLISLALLAVAVVVPFTWQVMQAELAQSRNMKAMRDSLDALEHLSTDCTPAAVQQASAQLLADSAQIDAAFAYLAKGSTDFRRLSLAMHKQSQAFAAQNRDRACTALVGVPALKNQCKQCHELFRTRKPR